MAEKFWDRWSWYDSVYSFAIGLGAGGVLALAWMGLADGHRPMRVLMLALPYFTVMGKVFLTCLFGGMCWSVARSPRKKPPTIKGWPDAFYHSRVSIFLFVLAVIFAVSLAPEGLAILEGLQ